MRHRGPQLARQEIDSLATKAGQLLDNPIFAGAWDDIGALIVQQLAETQLDGTRETEELILELVRRLQTLNGVYRLVERHVRTGEIATLMENEDNG